MKIRGHHLICILGYRGKGYDERFTSVMNEVMYLLELNPQLRINVIDDIDILCSACPNRTGNKCYTNQDNEAYKRIKRMDKLVLDAIEIKPNTLHSFEELQRKISLNFTLEDMNQLCINCEWKKLGYCKEGLLHLKNKY